MNNRFGSIEGFHKRIQLILIADSGNSINIYATCFIPSKWLGPPVIRWKGCSERLIFALDPSSDLFYFGSK